MEITATNLGKRYNQHWIFKNWTQTFKPNTAYAILGGNGSGKSTALRMLMGYAVASEGEVQYKKNGKTLPISKCYTTFSFCSPYLELYEELTLKEMARFHFSLKPSLPGVDISNFAGLIQLETSKNKAVKFFSSGMKQRLRLALALYSNTEIVYLDEPISNLDYDGITWYRDLVGSLRKNRLIFVASNRQEDETFFCEENIEIEKLKPR